MKLYLCEGYDPLFGPVRHLIRAAGFGEASVGHERDGPDG